MVTLDLGLCSGGFFSNCNLILMNIIHYFNNNKKLPLEIKIINMFLIYKEFN